MIRTEQDYSYFDEAYFELGATKGTAYSNYRDSARVSRTYAEIADAVIEVFHPSRVLEIGCATGIIVKHLNARGCEAWGIDVSEWAVSQAEHSNVKLASADALPFRDRHFDLVFSCHSLEHIPDHAFIKALAEMTRVSSAFQFHMLPILGVAPYDGQPDVVKQALRRDPTHHQLHPHPWWIKQFASCGNFAVDAAILFRHDTAQVELSSSQFVLKRHRSIDDVPVVRRSAERARRLFREAVKERAEMAAQGAQGKLGRRLEFLDRTWKDIERRLEPHEQLDLRNRTLRLVTVHEGEPCNLRLAVGEDAAGVSFASAAEYFVQASPGLNYYEFTTDNMRTLRGSPDFARINHVCFGGEAQHCSMSVYLFDQHGESLLECG